MNMIVGCQIAEHSFKILVGPLALPIGLRMKTRKQTRRGTDLSTKLLPKPGGKLRPPIWNHVNRQSMETEGVIHHQLGGLPGRGQFGQGNEINRLGKTIHHHENHSVTLRWGEPRDKIKGDVWPRTGRDGERMKQTIRRVIHRLTLGTSVAGQHELSDICGQCGPPETLTDGKQCSPNPWMADQPGLVPPLKDFRAQRIRHRMDGFGRKFPLWGPELVREGVWLDILGRIPREGEVESAKEECPAGLTRAQPLSWTNVFEILVIHPDQEGLRWPLQPVTPHAQGQSHRQQLLIANVIVTFCRAETTTEKCTWVHLPVAELPLRKNCANPDVRCVDLDNELGLGIWNQ